MNRMNHVFWGLIASAMFFVACGDDESKAVDVYDDVGRVLGTGEELSSEQCDSTTVGKRIFVTDSAESYFCDGRDWLVLRGGDGERGPAGSNGKKGAIGDKGATGDSALYEGNQGPVGEKGETGASSDVDCEIAGDSAGIITFKCSDGGKSKLYTALCDDSAYDPMEYFCLNGTLYSNAEYLLDTRDNHVYRYAVLGKGNSARGWMLENLNYELNDGEQSWCYKNASVNCEKYGRLYTWAAVLNRSEEECGYSKKCDVSNPFRGLCPDGWHVSTADEWVMLLELEKEDDSAGAMLRATNGWQKGIAGTDDLGFNALPGGYFKEGSCYGESTTALFWTSNFVDKYTSQSYGMVYDEKDVSYDPVDRDQGLALRCVKDEL